MKAVFMQPSLLTKATCARYDDERKPWIHRKLAI